MAKLTALPSQAIIDGFKGKVDYYLWMGIPVARRWPRSPGPRRATAVEAQWPAFGYVAGLWTSLSLEVQETYNRLAIGSGLSGRDMFTRAYLTGLFRYPTGGEEDMKLYLLDPELTVATQANIAASVPWTDIDLSPYVPTTARFALLRHHLDHDGPMVDGWIRQYTRMKGGTTVNYALAHKCRWQRGWQGQNDVFVEMDTNLFIQYKVDIDPGIDSVYLKIHLIGYGIQ